MGELEKILMDWERLNLPDVDLKGCKLGRLTSLVMGLRCVEQAKEEFPDLPCDTAEAERDILMNFWRETTEWFVKWFGDSE